MSSKRRNKKRMIMEKKRMEENNMTEQASVTAGSQKASPVEEVSGMPLAPKKPEQPVTVMENLDQPATVPEVPVQSVTIPEIPAAPVKKEVEKNLYLQYNNLEFSDHLMFEAAVNDYCQKTGVSAENIEAVNLYVKPEEGKAYYVINHDGEKIGSIDL